MVFPLKIKVEVEEVFTQNVIKKKKKVSGQGPESGPYSL